MDVKHWLGHRFWFPWWGTYGTVTFESIDGVTLRFCYCDRCGRVAWMERR